VVSPPGNRARGRCCVRLGLVHRQELRGLRAVEQPAQIAEHLGVNTDLLPVNDQRQAWVIKRVEYEACGAARCLSGGYGKAAIIPNRVLTYNL
jgi:hypothetical protein